jgi:hypothetical protein
VLRIRENANAVRESSLVLLTVYAAVCFDDGPFCKFSCNTSSHVGAAVAVIVVFLLIAVGAVVAVAFFARRRKMQESRRNSTGVELPSGNVQV